MYRYWLYFVLQALGICPKQSSISDKSLIDFSNFQQTSDLVLCLFVEVWWWKKNGQAAQPIKSSANDKWWPKLYRYDWPVDEITSDYKDEEEWESCDNQIVWDVDCYSNLEAEANIKN